MPTKKSMKIVNFFKYVTSLTSHKKTIDPGQVSFSFGFSFHNIMFLTYINLKETFNWEKNHGTLAYAFKSILA